MTLKSNVLTGIDSVDNMFAAISQMPDALPVEDVDHALNGERLSEQDALELSRAMHSKILQLTYLAERLDCYSYDTEPGRMPEQKVTAVRKALGYNK